MPASIIDGVWDTVRYVSMAKIITQTNLTILDLKE